MKKGVFMKNKARVLLVAGVLLALAASSSYAAIGRDGKAESFAATFEARAVGDPTITSCPGLGPDGQKIEARYEGMFTIAGDPPTERRLSLQLSVEILYDRSSGIGTAEGKWLLLDPTDRSIAGRGELLAVAKATEPPDPDLELRGMAIGHTEPPDPDLPAQMLLGNVSASLGDGATFPHLKGTVGDPSVGDPSVGDPSVGDPTVGDPSSPAVLLPSDPC